MFLCDYNGAVTSKVSKVSRASVALGITQRGGWKCSASNRP